MFERRPKTPLLRIDSAQKVPLEVTDQTFQREVISYPGPVLVDCCAPWCGPCRMVAPVLDQLAADYSGHVRIAKLNVEEVPTKATEFGVMSVPTLIVFKDGKEVSRFMGVQNEKTLLEALGL